MSLTLFDFRWTAAIPRAATARRQPPFLFLAVLAIILTASFATLGRATDGWNPALNSGPVLSTGTSYYVRTSGSDLNDGLTPASAWQTLGKAASVAQSGDTVFVGAGTYTGGLVIENKGSTTSARTMYFADRAGTYTGDAGSVTVQANTAVLTFLNSHQHVWE
ncbi:MAG TPA: hypothetical protein PLV92_28340, partial [Pirellulaceae bacterium]|nr:hypothetical protein [Pirellulaceae bacterium]